MSTKAIWVCKALSLNDTHLFNLKDFRVPIPWLYSATFTPAELFHADLSKSHDTSEENPT